VSTVIDGTAEEISEGRASLELALEILPETLLDVLRIRSTKPLRVEARGTMLRPVVLARDAVLRLGALVVGSLVEA
jgi:hypothetical protein